MPVHDDRRLFEKLILEGAQAGLSWITVLRRRDGYRRAFEGFDRDKIAAWGEAEIAARLADPGIIRNRLKVESAVTNARAWQEQFPDDGELATFLWSFVDGEPVVNRPRTLADLPAETASLPPDEPRAQAPRLPFRRPHHLLRLHAIDGAGQRPPRRLLPLRRAGRRALTAPSGAASPATAESL